VQARMNIADPIERMRVSLRVPDQAAMSSVHVTRRSDRCQVNVTTYAHCNIISLAVPINRGTIDRVHQHFFAIDARLDHAKRLDHHATLFSIRSLL
jgi:hypothetical protein